MVEVIYSRPMRGPIMIRRLLLTPLGLPTIICSLAACAHCLLINRCFTYSLGERTSPLSSTWITRVWDPEMRPTRSTVPLRTAGDCRAEWMAAFTAINSLLPNYLIHHMHTRLLYIMTTPSTHLPHHRCPTASHRSKGSQTEIGKGVKNIR